MGFVKIVHSRVQDFFIIMFFFHSRSYFFHFKISDTFITTTFLMSTTFLRMTFEHFNDALLKLVELETGTLDCSNLDFCS